MAVEKKSLINTRATAKKAVIAKESMKPQKEVSKSTHRNTLSSFRNQNTTSFNSRNTSSMSMRNKTAI